jgi:hypothetical protein
VIVIDRETRFRRSSRWAACPSKTSLTSWSKGASSRLAIMLARRAGCMETCSSGSREARRSNPCFVASVVLKRREVKVIPAFYPIPFLGKRATGKNLAKTIGEAVMVQSRCARADVSRKSCPGGSDQSASMHKSGGSPVRFVQPGRRGEFPLGNKRNRVRDGTRRWAEKAHGE